MQGGENMGIRDAELKELGIYKAKPIIETPRLTIGVEGLEKEGKTSFAFTLPDPLAVLTNDPMTKTIVAKEVAKGRDIFCREFKEAGTQKVGEKLWEEYKKVYTYCLNNFRSMVIDTDSGAWALQRMAAFGKLSQVMPNQYVTTNTRKRMMIREAGESNCNVCFVYKVKPEYKENKKGMGQWTGNYVREGFGETGYLLQVNLLAFKEPPGNGLSVEERFKIKVLNCTQNAELDGEVFEYPMVNFAMLAGEVFPENNIEDWE
jgi:hypothetical protein